MSERAVEWISPEYATVGSLLLEPAGLAAVQDWLRPEDFYHRSCGHAFETIVRLASQHATVDPTAVLAAMHGPKHERPSGLELFRMVEVVPDPSRVGYYGRLVVEASLFRQVEKAGAELVHAGAGRRGTVDDLFATVHQACTPVIAIRRRYDQATTAVGRDTGSGPVPIGRAIAADQVVVRIEQARALSR